MIGRIVNYRRSRHSQYEKQMVVSAEGVATKEAAAKLAGKKVVWKSPAGKRICGKISTPHGNKGAFKVIVESGLPGQAVGTTVEIS